MSEGVKMCKGHFSLTLYAPIIVTPSHPQHEVGWGVMLGFASCLVGH